MSLIKQVKEQAKFNHEYIVSLRRHLHQHPELSFQEHQTQAFVEHKLREMGITQIEHIAGTGLVAMIEGKNPKKKVVALRGDMDALPIKELNDVPYKSQ